MLMLGTYSGCCTLRSHAVNPREKERGSQRGTSWMNKPTDVISDFTATHWCHLTEFRGSHLPASMRRLILKKSLAGLMWRWGLTGLKIFPNTLTSGSDSVLLCLLCGFFWRTHRFCILKVIRKETVHSAKLGSSFSQSITTIPTKHAKHNSYLKTEAWSLVPTHTAACPFMRRGQPSIMMFNLVYIASNN